MAARRVLVGGAVADKASRMVSPSEAIVVQGPGRRFVSRGGEKLAVALDGFGVDVSGRRALDAGASTGGFTDCLLQRGAAHVYAVDVGHGQLEARLRSDPRVSVHERTNVRTLVPEQLGDAAHPYAPVDLAVADLSFISLVTVVPALRRVTAPAAELVVLVKPQFEAGRPEVSRGKGVIRDPGVWRRALDGVASALATAGTGIMGAMPSPITGPAGNVEFLLHARRDVAVTAADRSACLDRAVERAHVGASPGRPD